MAIETKKYLDLTCLTHFWENIKDYIDDKSTSAEGNFTKIAEEIELNPDTLEYDDVYENTKTVRGDIVGVKDEIDGLKNNITGIKGLSYTDIIAALEDTEPEVGLNYLKFIAEEDNSTISLSAATSPDIKYSLNGGEWTQWDYNAITLNTGDTVRMKGNNSNGFSTSSSSSNKFQMTGKISASGNIMSLLYDDDFEGKLTIPCKYCFSYMFQGCTSLTTAPELPATTLTSYCYYWMFNGCTSLTAAPELPSITLTYGCYNGMFHSCTSLTTAPELPATTLHEACYNRMFIGCTSLITAPELLPATTLKWNCYQMMFMNCTALTRAPELPAAKLSVSCYYRMFEGCSKLNYIKMLATDISANECTNDWVKGVASTGTFIKHPNMKKLPSSDWGIPKGWTVKNAA